MPLSRGHCGCAATGQPEARRMFGELARGAIMPLASHSLSAFVPHDLRAPIPGAASGPLAGLTCAVKDMYDIAGHRTGGGSPDWLAAAAPATPPARPGPQNFGAGAPVIGKTISDEVFFTLTGANAQYATPGT